MKRKGFSSSEYSAAYESRSYSKEIEEYSRQIPSEIKSAIRGLDHDVRCAILVCLLRNGGRLSFAELQEKLSISKGRLAYHLNLLIDGALVRNFSEVSLKDRYNSYYEVTEFATSFLENILKPIAILFPEEEYQLTPPQPADTSSFQDTLREAVMMLKIQDQNLDRIYSRIRARDEQLFKEVEKALVERDNSRALVYANKVAQVRKMGKIILSNRLALERVILRLEDTIDFKETKETLKILGPIVNVVNRVGSEIRNVAPQVAESLRQIEDMMNRVLIQAGEVSGYEPYVSTNREVGQILKEASILVSQKMKSNFPDVPEPLKQHMEETGSG